MSLKLWPYPQSEFQPAVEINETHLLNDEFDYTGKKLISFDFWGTPYSCESWADMFVKIVKILFDLDATRLYRLVKSDEGLGLNFTNKDKSGYSKIADKVYLWTASSTMSKITNIKKLFDYFEIEQNELQFEIESDND